MKPRVPRSIEDLKDAAKHVNYELEMFVHAAGLLGAPFASPRSPLREPEKCMALECFLLHFRNLRAFLCPSVQMLHRDDIIASDFLTPPQQCDVCDPSLLDFGKERLDGMLAHLSYRRDEYIGKAEDVWYIPAMGVAIDGAMRAFVASVLPELRSAFKLVGPARISESTTATSARIDRPDSGAR